MRYAATVVMVAFLVGCASQGTVTEGDRQVLDQTHKAGIAAGEAVSAGNTVAAQAAIGDVKLNMAQQLGVHGAPKSPLAYTPANSKTARDQSDKEHGAGGWGWDIMWGILGAVAAGAAGWFGGPALGNLVGNLASNVTGKYSKATQASVEAMTQARQTADLNGGHLKVEDLLRIFMNKQDEFGIQEFVADFAKRDEAKRSILHKTDLPKEIAGE